MIDKWFIDDATTGNSVPSSMFNVSTMSINEAFSPLLGIDYTLSRLLTISFYYDRQTNTPLLSSSSYPTTTQDFGLSIKFSLTR